MNFNPESKQFLLELLKENETVGQVKLAKKYGVSRRKIILALENAKTINAAPVSGKAAETSIRHHSEIDDDTAATIYCKVNGVDMPRASKVSLSKEYSVSRRGLDELIKRGQAVYNAKEVAAVDKARKAKSTEMISGAKSVDFAGMPPEAIVEIQKRVENGESKRSIAKETGLSRYKLDKLLDLKIETFKEGDITSISTGRSLLSELFPGTIYLIGIQYRMVVGRDVKSDETYYIPVGNECDDQEGSAPVIPSENTILEVIAEADFEICSNKTVDSEPSEIKVEVVDTSSDISNIFKAALMAETFGVVHLKNGGQASVNPDSDVLSECSLRTSDGFVSLDEIHVHRTVAASEMAKKSGVEADYTKRSSDYDGRSVELSKTAGYRQFVTSSQANIVRNADGESATVSHQHQLYGAVCELLKAGKVEEAFNLIKSKATVKDFNGEFVDWKMGDAYITLKTLGNHKLENIEIVKRFEVLANDSNLEHMVYLDRFVGKMIENPSRKIFERITKFMAYGDVQICEDGDIYVYKAVNSRYRDDYTGTIDNSVGCIVFMKRFLIDENTDTLCSQGLHVCSLDYVNQMSGYNKSNGKIMRVKLSPADIVAIPNDYANRKIRCCRYEVVEDVTTQYHSGKLKADAVGSFS